MFGGGALRTEDAGAMAFIAVACSSIMTSASFPPAFAAAGETCHSCCAYLCL